MARVIDLPADQRTQRRSAEIASLLGMPGRIPAGGLEVHDLVARGIPASALLHAYQQVEVLRDEHAFTRIMAMSLRSLQRLRDKPSAVLALDAGGRLWRFAEILAKAADVLGSREAAQRWLAGPVMGLDQRRPIDLLATPAGTAMVDEFLDRLDHGVYT